MNDIVDISMLPVRDFKAKFSSGKSSDTLNTLDHFPNFKPQSCENIPDKDPVQCPGTSTRKFLDLRATVDGQRYPNSNIFSDNESKCVGLINIQRFWSY